MKSRKAPVSGLDFVGTKQVRGVKRGVPELPSDAAKCSQVFFGGEDELINQFKGRVRVSP